MDVEFQNTSQLLINKFKKGEMIAVVSELTKTELKRTPRGSEYTHRNT